MEPIPAGAVFARAERKNNQKKFGSKEKVTIFAPRLKQERIL
jgi:hypothetical protein